MTRFWSAAAAAAGLLIAAAPAMAEQGDVVSGAYETLEPVQLYDDGTGPGWEGWPGNLGIVQEGDLGGAAGAIYNVSVPTYTAYLPVPERNTGTAVIIAPGGGFRLLAMGHEGRQVAEYLAERGVAAFVLKYRLAQLENVADYAKSMQTMPIDQAGALGAADGMQAIALIRARAGEYGIDPDRIGIVGFSAGGHVSSMAGLAEDPDARPDFVGAIYGVPFGDMPDIPSSDAASSLPPFFVADAANDTTVDPDMVINFVQRLRSAGYAPEYHLFRDGGHGFGMADQGTTSDKWIDDFFYWMTDLGLTRKPGDAPHEFTPMPGPNLGGN